MIVDSLKRVIERYEGDNPLFLRTLLKEYIQNYILNFVYTSSNYKELLFTGGTCLRKVYGLNRLSEDLDFDYEMDFSIEAFRDELEDYLKSTFDFKDIGFKVSNNERSLIVEFGILDSLGLVETSADMQSLFIRCDFAKEDAGNFGFDIRTLSTPEFTFFARCYDLPTLYSNKLTAFLKRTFYKGANQGISFKGRDIYDLVWFRERSLRGNLGPNEARLQALLNMDSLETWEKVKEKIALIEPGDVYKDLAPFLSSDGAARDFARNFKKVLLN